MRMSEKCHNNNHNNKNYDNPLTSRLIGGGKNDKVKDNICFGNSFLDNNLFSHTKELLGRIKGL